MRKPFYILLILLSLGCSYSGAMAGEDPNIIYTKRNGYIDTSAHTASDGYLRNNTKLVITCETSGPNCPTTPNPPLPPQGKPDALDDSLYHHNRPWNVITNSPGVTASMPSGGCWPNCPMRFFLPVLNNDDPGPNGPVTITAATVTSSYWDRHGEAVNWQDWAQWGVSKPTATVRILSNGLEVQYQYNTDVTANITLSYTITDKMGQTDTASVSFANAIYDSPLVLDLGGDRIKLLPMSHGVMFDINMDGMLDNVSWIHPSDGFLALDSNLDGVITRNELFGNEMESKIGDGFENLRRYDINDDFYIDANDEIYGRLQIWQDMNSNGISEPNELKGLVQLSIKSINLNPVLTNFMAGEHWITHDGHYEMMDGTQRQIADIWFRSKLAAMPIQEPAPEAAPQVEAQPQLQPAGKSQ